MCCGVDRKGGRFKRRVCSVLENCDRECNGVEGESHPLAGQDTMLMTVLRGGRISPKLRRSNLGGVGGWGAVTGWATTFDLRLSSALFLSLPSKMRGLYNPCSHCQDKTRSDENTDNVLSISI